MEVLEGQYDPAGQILSTGAPPQPSSGDISVSYGLHEEIGPVAFLTVAGEGQ
jgi:hypothetical protein